MKKNTVGRTLKALRKMRGLTQEQLAERVKLSRTSIVQMEQGGQVVTTHHLEVIADVLGYEVQYQFKLKK